MLNSARVAVTGGLSSGKSLLCAALGRLGACVVSADAEVHDLFVSDSALVASMVDLLGAQILENGRVQRRRVAQRIFQEPHLLPHLEDLVHPLVYKRIKEKYTWCSRLHRAPHLFVAEVPLLFEGPQASSYTSWFDHTVSVVAREADALDRFLKRGGTLEEYHFWSTRQWSPLRKAACADYIILNFGSHHQLKAMAAELYSHLTSHPVSREINP